MTKELLAEWPSDSSEKTYKLEKDDETGVISCTCLSWLTKKRQLGQDCKHVTAYRKAMKELQEAAQA